MESRTCPSLYYIFEDCGHVYVCLLYTAQLIVLSRLLGHIVVSDANVA